jgi:hypothetical protein
MPYSSVVFDEEIKNILTCVAPCKVLDLGAGAGKYGLMVKDINSTTEVIAVESEKDYIRRFKLTSIYNVVWRMSVTDLIQPNYYDAQFDVIIAGDILEHLRKTDGINLINFLIYRCRWLIVEFPHRYLQNSVDGHDGEAHISAWSESDFAGFECTKMRSEDTQRLIILRGYQEDKISIDNIESIIENHERKSIR